MLYKIIIVDWLLEDTWRGLPGPLGEIRDEAGNVARYDRSQGVVEEGKGSAGIHLGR